MPPQTALLDQIPFPAWLRDADLRLTYVNAAYAAVAGASEPVRAIAAQTEVGAGQLGPDGRALARRVLRTGREQTESVSMVVNGSRRLFQITERPLGCGGIAGFAEEMTALDAAQAELVSHMSSHQEVLEQLRTGIAVFDSERRLRFVNRAYADMWGLDYDWLRHGPTLTEILEALREQRRLPEVIDFAAFRRQLDQRFQTLINPQEELLHLPDTRCFREVCAPHPLGGLVFVFEDVTDRLALERSYNTLIDVQRGILDQLADGIAAFGTDARLTLVNPAFFALAGIAGGRIASGEHLASILARLRMLVKDPAAWEAFCEAAQRSVNARDVARQRVLFSDGRILDLTLAPLADGSVLMTIRDITDTHNVERVLLERNAALEETNRLKTDFLANASYELRTPLTTISGFAELLMEEVGGPTTEGQRGYLRGILQASETLAALVDSILDVSPDETGVIDSHATELALGPVLNSVAEVVRPQVESKRARLTVRTSPGLGPIQADERRMRQLVFNLLSAAARLSIGGSTILVSCTGEAESVILTARVETGLGPAEIRGIESELTLTLVHRLTELHGGTMRIEVDDQQTISIVCTLTRKRFLFHAGSAIAAGAGGWQAELRHLPNATSVGRQPPQEPSG